MTTLSIRLKSKYPNWDRQQKWTVGRVGPHSSGYFVTESVRVNSFAVSLKSYGPLYYVFRVVNQRLT